MAPAAATTATVDGSHCSVINPEAFKDGFSVGALLTYLARCVCVLTSPACHAVPHQHHARQRSAEMPTHHRDVLRQSPKGMVGSRPPQGTNNAPRAGTAASTAKASLAKVQGLLTTLEK
jgi:hypothetical protein